HFKANNYQLQVYGPNGFFRGFKGDKKDPFIQIECGYQRVQQQRNKLTGNVELHVRNQDRRIHTIRVIDNGYGRSDITKKIQPAERKWLVMNLKASYGWYDFSVKVDGYDAFSRQFAGRVETGKASYSDPQLG